MANKTSVDKIRGISPELAAKLKQHKILNTEQLLSASASPEGRKTLARSIGSDTRELLELVNRADLDRVPGIGSSYANLLEEVGVDTVRELAKRVPAHLHEKILEVNKQKTITTRPPTLQQVEAWVTQAKGLPIILEY